MEPIKQTLGHSLMGAGGATAWWQSEEVPPVTDGQGPRGNEQRELHIRLGPATLALPGRR